MQLNLINGDRLPSTSDYDINRSIEDLTRRLRDSGANWRVSGGKRKKEMGLFLETEICYLQREIMWRRCREVHHQNYLKGLQKR